MTAPSVVLGRLAGRRLLVSWRGVEVPSYTAMLYLGCVAGTLVGAVVAGSAGLERSRFAFTTVVLLIPALAGSRLWFVLEHLSVYRREPGRIWRRSEGGSALHGGFLLSLALSVPLLALVQLPFWAYWDAASFTLLIGIAFTRIGCVMHGCCAGRPTSGRVGVWLPDHRGLWQRRVPTQLLEAAWATLVLTGAFIAHAGRPAAGAVFFGALAASGAGRLLLETTRLTAGSAGSKANIAVSALMVLGGTIALVAGLGG
jgi:phosphatidylglycerol---prolipoprotein diacylglyceryl transferase